MIPGQLRDFITDLRRATDDGRARWNGTPFGGFTCDKKDIRISIWHFVHEDASFEVIGFRVADNDGETKFFVDENESDYHDMRTLFSAASASANNFAVKLKDLF